MEGAIRPAAEESVDVSSSPLCQYCGLPSILVGGQAVYPKFPAWWERFFYACPPCDAYVGCHPGTKVALGTLANAELRAMRKRAHRAFDRTWKGGDRSRSQAYKWLANQLGITSQQCHVAMFDVQQCQKIIGICHSYLREKSNHEAVNRPS